MLDITATYEIQPLFTIIDEKFECRGSIGTHHQTNIIEDLFCKSQIFEPLIYQPVRQKP